MESEHRLDNQGNGPAEPVSLPRRLAYLDGIRGLTALYIVAFHAAEEAHDARYVEVPLRTILSFGDSVVTIFIVLSGYVLAWPSIRAGRLELPDGFRRYIGRRARRIIPPYYAALVLTILAAEVDPGLRHAQGVRWDNALPLNSPGGIATHVLLVHNFFSDWVYLIDPPAWTIAAEWQIYFALPLLLWIWRRSATAAVVLAFSIGYGITLAAWACGMKYFSQTGMMFLGPFALGMVASSAIRSPVRRDALLVGVVVSTAALAIGVLGSRWLGVRKEWTTMTFNVFVSAATAAFLVACSDSLVRRGGGIASRVRRWLETPPLVALGAMSYSLYLTHFVVLAAVDIVSRGRGYSMLARHEILLAVGVPASLVVAYVFHVLIERRFLAAKGPRMAGDPPMQAG